jgi:hypothetical protein
MTAATAMKELHRLHSCLWWLSSTGKPGRILGDPTEMQVQILRAFYETSLFTDCTVNLDNIQAVQRANRI